LLFFENFSGRTDACLSRDSVFTIAIRF